MTLKKVNTETIQTLKKVNTETLSNILVPSWWESLWYFCSQVIIDYINVHCTVIVTTWEQRYHKTSHQLGTFIFDNVSVFTFFKVWITIMWETIEFTKSNVPIRNNLGTVYPQSLMEDKQFGPTTTWTARAQQAVHCQCSVHWCGGSGYTRFGVRLGPCS